MGQFVMAHFDGFLAALVTLSVVLIQLVAKPRVRLRYATLHGFTYLVPEPQLDQEGKVIALTQTVQTRSIHIVNTGRQKATDVEVVFNWKPMVWNLWPIREFKEKISADNRLIITFASLAPKESFKLELLSVNAGLPDLLNVRANESEGQHDEVTWFPSVSEARIRSVLFLMILGGFTVLYMVIYAAEAAYKQMSQAPASTATTPHSGA